MADDVRARLQQELRRAMLAGDRSLTSALRSSLGAIANAEAVDSPADAPPGDASFAGSYSGIGAAEAPRRTVSEDEQVAVVVTEVKELRDAAELRDASGRPADGEDLRRVATVLEGLARTTG